MSLKPEEALGAAIDYVNKTIQGEGALKGQDGFSPIITENADNADELYRLDITTKDSNITTPNLIGKQGEKGDKGDKGEQGIQGEKGESSVAAIVPRGDYNINASPTYSINDYVTYTDGNTYVCKAENPTNIAPIDGSANDIYWQLIALRGAKGENGTTFTPEIDDNGNLNWSNDGEMKNPQSVNLANIKISNLPDNAIYQKEDGAYVKKVDADLLEYVNTTQGIEDTPVGHIISCIANSAPKHYLICDGKIYNISDYPYLAQHFKDEFGKYNYFGGDGKTTFAVPDLRGEFLRGTGTAARNSGSGADVGVHQDGTIINTFRVRKNGILNVYADKNSELGVGNSDKNITTGNEVSGYYINPSSSFETGASSQRHTSRPTNTSVLYCIKYEPTYFIQNTGTYNGDIIGNKGLIIENNKVDVNFEKVQAKEFGKGLSTNDYTNEDKERLNNVDTVPEKDSTNLITSGGVYDALNSKLDNIPASGEEYNTGRVWLDGSPIYRRDFCVVVNNTSKQYTNGAVYFADIYSDVQDVTIISAQAFGSLGITDYYYTGNTDWHPVTFDNLGVYFNEIPSGTGFTHILIYGWIEYRKSIYAGETIQKIFK